MGKIDYSKKVERALKGASWAEAREIGICIVAKCLAYELYVSKGNEATPNLYDDITKRMETWIHDEGGSSVLSMARVSRMNHNQDVVNLDELLGSMKSEQ